MEKKIKIKRLRPWPRLLSWLVAGSLGSNHNMPWGKADRFAGKTKKPFHGGFQNHCHYTLASISRAHCSLWFQILFVPTLNVWFSLERLRMLCHESQRPTTGILSIRCCSDDRIHLMSMGPTLTWYIPEGARDLVTLPVLRLAPHASYS